MSSNKYITVSSSSPAAEMDPAAPGTFIRYAMATEGVLNTLGALPMLLVPATLLRYITTSPLEVTDTSIALMRWTGTLVLALTPQLFLALPNTRSAIESRRMVYLTLGAGEMTLPATLLWQAYQAADVEIGITRNALLVMAGVLAPFLFLRVYVLFVKPSLLRRYRVRGKTE